MLDWLNSEGDDMRVACSKVFGSTVKQFGSAALQAGGFSDARQGVQRTDAYDPRDGTPAELAIRRVVEYDWRRVGGVLEKTGEACVWGPAPGVRSPTKTKKAWAGGVRLEVGKNGPPRGASPRARRGRLPGPGFPAGGRRRGRRQQVVDPGWARDGSGGDVGRGG